MVTQKKVLENLKKLGLECEKKNIDIFSNIPISENKLKRVKKLKL